MAVRVRPAAPIPETKSNLGRYVVMDLIHLIIVLAVTGLVWWLVTTYLPLPAPVKMVINVLVVVILCIWLLQWAGLTRIGHLG